MSAVCFTVVGVAQPKGSLRAFVKPGARFATVTEDNLRTRPWAALVTDAARQAVGDAMAFPDGGVHLAVAFILPRPKSLPKRVTTHTKRPDLDKLVRAVKDAMTGVVWRDDSQVVELVTAKRYCGGVEQPHARISVCRAIA